jgi:hypothetical protein
LDKGKDVGQKFRFYEGLYGFLLNEPSKIVFDLLSYPLNPFEKPESRETPKFPKWVSLSIVV